jgi:hypothetical protein
LKDFRHGRVEERSGLIDLRQEGERVGEGKEPRFHGEG